MNYNLFVKAVCTVAADNKNLEESLRTFIGLVLKNPNSVDDFLKNSWPVIADELIFPESEINHLTVSEFMSDFYNKILSPTQQDILDVCVNGTTVYGYAVVICNQIGGHTDLIDDICDALVCDDPINDLDECLESTNTKLVALVLSAVGLSESRVSYILGTYLVRYSGMYFDHIKSLELGLQDLTYKDLTDYFLNQKPCRDNNKAIVLISRLFKLYDEESGYCGVSLEERFSLLRREGIARNIYKMLIPNPFLYISLLLCLILVVIPVVFFVGSFIGLCTKSICCNAIALSFLFLIPVVFCVLVLVLSVIAIFVTNGLSYNIFGLI